MGERGRSNFKETFRFFDDLWKKKYNETHALSNFEKYYFIQMF